MVLFTRGSSLKYKYDNVPWSTSSGPYDVALTVIVYGGSFSCRPAPWPWGYMVMHDSRGAEVLNVTQVGINTVCMTRITPTK